MNNNFINTLFIKSIVRISCLIKGVKLQRATSEKQIQKTYLFRNQIQNETSINGRINKNKDGLAHSWSIVKRGEIIANICLFDPTIVKPYSEYIFENDLLCYNPKKTYELGEIAIKNKKSHNFYFLILMLQCHISSLKDKRTNWLVCEHKMVSDLVQTLGGEVEVLSQDSMLHQSTSRIPVANQVRMNNFNSYKACLLKTERMNINLLARNLFSKKIEISDGNHIYKNTNTETTIAL